MLFLFFIVRPLLNLAARKTNSFNNPDGPSQTYILAVLMAVFISGWFMAAIGISEIFGGELLVDLSCSRFRNTRRAQRD